jgi:hypothetical protein
MKRPRRRDQFVRVGADDTEGSQAGKAILLHGFSPAQVHAVVRAYRSHAELPQDAAFAVVTEQSSRRRLGDVVAELQEEARRGAGRRGARASGTPERGNGGSD